MILILLRGTSLETYGSSVFGNLPMMLVILEFLHIICLFSLPLSFYLQPNYNHNERALYAALSGNIKHVRTNMLCIICIYILHVIITHCRSYLPATTGWTMFGHILKSWWMFLLNRYSPSSLDHHLNQYPLILTL